MSIAHAAAQANGYAATNGEAIAEFLGNDPLKLELYEAAGALHQRGLPIVLTDAKRPMGGAEWHRRPFAPAAASSLLRQAKEPGIGLLLGPSSGIVDIEADGPEEEALVAVLFGAAQPPPTPTYQSTRGLHRLYAWDDRLAATGQAVVSFAAGGAKLGCRLGAGDKGAQSVIPPSPGREWLPGLSLDDVDPAPLPDAVVQRLLQAAAGQRRPTHPLSPSAAAPAAAATAPNPAMLAAMDRATAHMQDGGDGSRRLYACCCRGVEYGGSDGEIIATIRRYAETHPFPSAWTDAEIVQRIRDAEKQVERGSAVVIRNYEEVEIEVDGVMEGDEKQTETVKVPLSLGQIDDDIKALTGGQPYRVDATLFVDDDAYGLAFFDKSPIASLFGYLRRRANVDWLKGGKFVAQSELTAELQRTAKRFDAIENTPHEPPIENIYYRCKAPKPGNGDHLRWLLDRFRPETTVDRDLLQAAAMTLIWGGPPGCRPAFVFTSEHGRGVGKTAAATMLARIVGGHIDVSQNEDGDKLMTRLLTPAARLKRVGLWDNIKSMRLSSERVEALITTPQLSGRQLYVGEGTRPNLLTWFLTLNGVSMATDLAQRSVIIRLVRGDNSGPWLEDTAAFIDQHREQIIGDLIAALRAEPFPLAKFSRWATWEKDVLSRLPEPGEAQRVILERQGAANCDLDEGEIVDQHFAEQLVRLQYDPRSAQVRIPVAVAARWFSWATGEPVKTATASRRLNQMAGEGTLKRLAPDPSRHYGRCFVWTGEYADVFKDAIANDLTTRIAQFSQSG
ncbi:MAG: bifunctional DNA primase/polymerase [Pirellulales bacterium]|nr:bifunctional DNA primase/polymerase [Pirellulales bacterium]